MPAGGITRYLDKLAEYYGYPFKIRVGNGAKFTGKAFTNWIEVLDLYFFNNLQQVRKITEGWLTIYNTEIPHEALNNMALIEYRTLKQAV